MMGRQTGVTGLGVVPADGNHGGPITILLGRKEYKARWVYMQTGGSLGLVTEVAVSGGGIVAASGTFIGRPTGGNGSVIASAPDGSALRCVFNFSEWDLRGVGVCKDNRGETYDLQIS
jgi:hypothetical protein